MITVKDKILKKKCAIDWNRRLSETEYTQRKLPFGMYCGKMIKDVPVKYLEWGILNLDSHWADFFSREYQRRKPNFIKTKKRRY